MRPLFFILILFAGFNSHGAAPPETLEQVGSSSEWKALLHYRTTLFGREQSESDGPEFFFSPEGHNNPVEELRANIEAMKPTSDYKIGHKKQHPQCAFPARWSFIKKNINPGFQNLECPDFKEWKESFRAVGVTLIYVAPYLGSPASMFGHTFLRIDSAPKPNQRIKNDYLDFGVAYEAAATSGDPLYIFRGLLGGYRGFFYQYPYHLKINHYNNFEARDLWEYQLNFSAEELDFMLSHLWELGSNHFDYYFFDENCSYHLLGLIEAARPHLNLRKQFKFFTIPSDTVRVAQDRKAVGKTTYRPSILKILEARLKQQNSAQRSEFYKYRNQVDRTPDSISTEALDALLDWEKYQAMKKGINLDDIDKHINFRLLQLRASRRTPPQHPEIEKDSFPEYGHKTSKYGSELGSDRGDGFINLYLRPALHDFLDSDHGFLTGSKMILFAASGGVLFSPEPRFRLEDLTFAEVGTIAPFNRLRNNFSWRLGGGLYRPRDIECRDCVVSQIRGGYGIAVKLIESSWININSYIMPIGNIEGGGGLERSYRLSPGADGGLLISLNENLKWQISARYLRHYRFDETGPDETVSTSSLISAHHKEWDFRLQYEDSKSLVTQSKILGFGIFRYF